MQRMLSHVFSTRDDTDIVVTPFIVHALIANASEADAAHAGSVNRP